jgi:glycosyltransferase involved in cell wall biosynthesis
MALPYIIWTPPYYQQSAGIRVIHKLVHLLNDAGYEAYATSGIINPKWNEPKATQYDTENSIAVYPEIVNGNPLGIKNVVRYILQTPGIFGEEKQYGKDDLFVYYSRMFHDEGPYLNIPVIEREWFRSVPRYIRSGNVYWLGTKNITTPSPDKVRGWRQITQEWPESREELADLLKRSKCLYVWDAMSMLVSEATLCGCPVVIMDEGRFSKRQIEKAELGTAGYAWSEKDFDKATKTVHLAESNYDKVESLLPSAIKEFIDLTQNRFKSSSTVNIIKSKVKVSCMVDSSDNGSQYYRVNMPLSYLNKSDKVDLRIIKKGDDASLIESNLDADVFYTPHLSNTQLFDALSDVPKAKQVLDYDDDLFHVSPMSTHYKDLGTESVWFNTSSGEQLPVWVDGKNIDIKRNKETLRQLKMCMARADAITVTTDILAEQYSKYANKIKVIPNLMDFSRWRKLNIVDDGIIRLFWAGGSSHYDDWYIMKDILPKVMNKYPQTRLVLMGSMWTGTIQGIDSSRIDFYPWVHSEAYPFAVTTLNPTIGLIPLKPNDFSRCKSPIKWMEMAALDVPCVMSAVSPYSEIMEEDNGIFIDDNDPDMWEEGISLLIEDKELRKNIGQGAYKYVSSHFDVNTQWKRYEDFFLEIS